MTRMVALLGFGCSIAVAGAQEHALSLIQMQAQRRSGKMQADEDGNQPDTTGNWPVASASHWGPSSTCTVTDDTAFSVFDGGKVSLLQADIDGGSGFTLKDIISHDGEHKDMWLVRGRAHDESTVRIEARYWRNVSSKGHQVFLKSLAIGGGFITNRTLIIRPMQDEITWYNRKESKAILTEESSTFQVEGLVNATRKGAGYNSSVEVQLPKGLKLLITRKNKYVNVAITMPPLAVQDGLCGNFNGDASDDKLGMILARGPRVQDKNSLFPAEFVPAVQHDGEVQMQLGEVHESGAVLKESRTRVPILEEERSGEKAFEEELGMADNVWAREQRIVDESYNTTLYHAGGKSASKQSSWASDWAGNQAVSCASGEVLAALYSEHASGKADRRWKYTCEAIDSKYANLTACRWSGWTAWSRAWYVTGNGNEVMTGMESFYDKNHADRRYKFQMCSVSFVDGATGGISNNLGYGGLLNEWTEPVDHFTSTSQFLTGIYSEHNERLVDRRWKFERKVFKYKVDASWEEHLMSPAITGGQPAELVPNATDSDSPVAEEPAAEAPATNADAREENAETRQAHHDEVAAEHQANADAREEDNDEVAAEHQANADAREEDAENRQADHDEVAAEHQANADARDNDGPPTDAAETAAEAKPAAEQPTVEAAQSAEDASVRAAEEPAVEAPAAEEPAAAAPASEVAVTDQLIPEEPAVEAPATEEPAAEQPAVEAPAAEEPAVEDTVSATVQEAASRVAAAAAGYEVGDDLQQERTGANLASSICTIADEPHITVFDGKQISLLQARGFRSHVKLWDLLNIQDGEMADVWLVNGHAEDGSSVRIQARYARNDSMPERQVFVKSVAIGGDFFANNTLVIRPVDDHVTFATPEGVCQNVLEEQESKFRIKGLFKAKRHMKAALVEDPSVEHAGIEIKMKHHLRLLVNRQQHYVNVMITMPPLQSQDGLCGNFNGDSSDDSLEMIEERDPRVTEGESLFPVA